ncbi:MAG: cobalamin-binding protein, partial [Alphaproteobacteria bacterium]|nr:cobalamin-binding protein [Alphaproteobacteria bacterium]
RFQPEQLCARQGWKDIPAIRTGHIFEIKSPEILQPGPAALTDGIQRLHTIICGWADETQ